MMLAKEQIIIDGIQFNEFGDFYVDYDFNGKFQSISSSSKEYKILKSLIEQLARKTQECEELKKQFDTSEKWRIKAENLNFTKGGEMKKFVKCSHCGNCEWFEVDTSLAKFDGDENEILQKECLRLQNKIDKLQYKHDFSDLTSWQLNDVNNRLSALKKILDILENYI